MPDLSTLPQEVNITAYAGDTLPIHIKIDSTLIAGRTFFAQVRAKKTASKIDATFAVILTATGCDIVLSSADSARLAARGEYNGYWDVQLAEADGDDPVTTLGFGTLTLLNDVTRAQT